MLQSIERKLINHLNSPLVRQRVMLESPQGVRIRVQGREYLSFSSNDYLGLANHPQVIAAMQQGARHWGTGSGSADLVCGHLQPHHELEQALAQATGRERALLLPSGYQANLAVISALLDKGQRILHDRLNHASLLDASLLAQARLRRYRHADINSLQQLINSTSGLGLVVTDAVFSMDGTVAPLPQICQLLQQQDELALMVDDAHGFGVLGKNGAGTLAQLGISQQQAPVLMCTLGKALGTGGAFVAGSQQLIEALVQFARPYIYSTSISPALACASLGSLRLMQQEQWRRDHLQELIELLRQQAQRLELQLLPSNTAIQPLIIGDNRQALQLAEDLRKLGIWVTAIRPPTVPAGSARLRITLSAAHGKADVLALVAALEQTLYG